MRAGSPLGSSSPPSAAGLVDRFPVLAPPTTVAGAAVTIVLRDGISEPEILLIERAVHPDDPASGDVALPGGRVDETDGSLAATALRELREEVGLAPADLLGAPRFVGATPAPRFGLHVGVFTAVLGPSAAPPTIGSPSEVAHVFWLPGSAVSEARRITREGVRGPRPVLAAVHDGHVVWGFTRRVLREFLELPAEDGSNSLTPSPPAGPSAPAGDPYRSR